MPSQNRLVQIIWTIWLFELGRQRSNLHAMGKKRSSYIGSVEQLRAGKTSSQEQHPSVLNSQLNPSRMVKHSVTPSANDVQKDAKSQDKSELCVT